MNADISNIKYKSVKMLLLKVGSELANLVKSSDPFWRYGKMQTEFPWSGMHPPPPQKKQTIFSGNTETFWPKVVMSPTNLVGEICW